jgi:molybdate transport repressor ModE-like protein
MIDSRHLRYVLTVAREGSFSRAAEVLGLSQPALSTSISRLEDVLQVQIFERGRHGSSLTAAGRALVLHAEQVENVLETAEREIRLGEDKVSGPLRIGGTPLALMSIVPAAIAQLMNGDQGLSFDIMEATDPELVAGLRNYSIDLAVSAIDIGAPIPDIEDIPLFSCGISAILRKDHPLAGKARVSLDEVRAHQLALPRPVGTYGTQLDAMFLIAGQSIPPATIFTSTFAALREVVLQAGVATLVPFQIFKPDIERGLIVAVPLLESVGQRTFALRRAAGRRLPEVGERLCDALQALAPTYQA